uniref:Uncharacterized protein n=1 Tax=Cacopsylla melanoneura TaxID=428564 RepID=A0A8D8UCY0_9HEMI
MTKNASFSSFYHSSLSSIIHVLSVFSTQHPFTQSYTVHPAQQPRHSSNQLQQYIMFSVHTHSQMRYQNDILYFVILTIPLFMFHTFHFTTDILISSFLHKLQFKISCN